MRRGWLGWKNFGVYGTGGDATVRGVHDSTHRRQAGILLPVFSLRRDQDLGIGDTQALREWIDWAGRHGVGFIQLLPIQENGHEESPYSAISSVAIDPIYLALEPAEIPGLDRRDLDDARRDLGGAIEAADVDYPAVRRIKRRLLRLSWSRFKDCPGELANEFARFRHDEADWLDDYCIFRFLMDHFGEDLTWDQWPEGCRSPAGARGAIEGLRSDGSARVDDELGFCAYIQWLCFRQWRALRAHADAQGVRLMGDVPIGVSWHSCDVFFHPDEFHLDWCGGAPSEGWSQRDPFFQQWGQNWGIPLYRWNHMKTNGFAWWKERIQRLTATFQMFRLDHILGFYRIYAFPWHPRRNHEFLGLNHEQAAALTGGRLPRWFVRPDDSDDHKSANRADGDERLRAVLDAAAGAEVIAEDLGWVPDYVRPHLTELGIAGFRIPHWDCDAAGHPTPGSQFPEHSFAAYSTHDHDPINGVWRACVRTVQQHAQRSAEVQDWQADGAHHTLRILAEFAGIPIAEDRRWPSYTDGIQLMLLKGLLACQSRYVSLMVTELFALDVRINQPGSTGDHNWSFRLPWSLAEIEGDPVLNAKCRQFSTLIHLSGRAPS